MKKPSIKEDAYARIRATQDVSQTEAYIGAGYSVMSADAMQVEATRIEQRPHVKARIMAIRDKANKGDVADLHERLTSATEILRDDEASFKTKLAANELLGKYGRDFVQQIENKNYNMDDVARLMEILDRYGLGEKLREAMANEEAERGG